MDFWTKGINICGPPTYSSVFGMKVARLFLKLIKVDRKNKVFADFGVNVDEKVKLAQR